MKSASVLCLPILVILSVIFSLACNATAYLPGDQEATPSPEPTLSPTEAPTEESIERVQLDPCTLLTAEEVGEVLGGPVDMQPAGGTGGCMYLLQLEDPSATTQLVVSAAQGNEAKAFTLLSLGLLAGFSGDPNMMTEFESLNSQLPELTLSEVINRMAELFQGTAVEVVQADGPGETALWLLYEDDFYAQGTLLLVREDEYVSQTLIGGDMDSAPDQLAALGAIVFERLPQNFYILDEDGDGTFSFEYSSGDEEGVDTPATEEATRPEVSGLVWVTAPNDGQVHAIDPTTDEVIKTIEVGRFPRDIAVSDGDVWVLSETEGAIWRIDPNSFQIIESISFDGVTTWLDADPGSVWVSGPLGVRKIDLNTNTRYGVVYNACYDVAIGEAAVWVSQPFDRQLLQIDPESRKVVATVKLDGEPDRVIYGHGLVWTVLRDKKELVGIDPASGQVVFTQAFEYVIHDLAIGPERLWYTGPTAIQYIEPESETVGGFSANSPPFGLVYYGDSLWTTGGNEGLITRYDPETQSVLAEIKVSTDTSGIAAGD